MTSAGLVLAAGESSRMGQLKQLLPFRTGTLLSHTIETAASAGFEPLLVVVGANAEAVRDSIISMPVEVVPNPEWRLGMGSSIAAGIKRLQEINGQAEAVAILLGDQPLVTARHLGEMLALLERGPACAVAAEYNGRMGVPAIFKRTLFERLAALEPASGAKKLLTDPEIKAVAYPLPEAAVDIDTPADFAKL